MSRWSETEDPANSNNSFPSPSTPDPTKTNALLSHQVILAGKTQLEFVRGVHFRWLQRVSAARCPLPSSTVYKYLRGSNYDVVATDTDGSLVFTGTATMRLHPWVSGLIAAQAGGHKDGVYTSMTCQYSSGNTGAPMVILKAASVDKVVQVDNSKSDWTNQNGNALYCSVLWHKTTRRCPYEWKTPSTAESREKPLEALSDAKISPFGP